MTVAGASPLFPPACQTEAEAKSRVLRVMRRDPSREADASPSSRWTLKRIRQSCDWLQLETDSGMAQLLDRIGLSYTRGRTFVESPDEDFDEKCRYLDRLQTWVAEDESQRVVYLDELQYYKHPEPGCGWETRGCQPTVDRPTASKYDWSRHVLAAVGADRGQLTWHQAPGIDRDMLRTWYHHLVEIHSEVDRLWIHLDNWPVHFHIDVLKSLESQRWPWTFRSPPNWPDPSEAAEHPGDLPVQLVPFPVYASWLNPVERLWRQLKRQVLALHRDALEPDRLVERVEAFFNMREGNPSQVLREVGLSS